MDRRTYLAMISGASFATTTGCIGFLRSQQMRPAEDPWRDVETDTGENGGASVVRGQAVLPAGTFAAKQFEIEMVAVVAIRFETAASPIDVLLMRAGEFERYREGESARYLGGSLLNRTQAQTQTRVDTGDYRIVLDNTNWGRAEPDGEARIGFVFAVRGA